MGKLKLIAGGALLGLLAFTAWSNNRLRDKNAELNLSLEQTVEANASVLTTLTDVQEEHQKCIKKITTSESAQEAALAELAESEAELHRAARERSQLRRAIRANNPSCAKLEDIDIFDTCPRLASSLRAESSRSD